jgi:hypothetical protein
MVFDFNRKFDEDGESEEGDFDEYLEELFDLLAEAPEGKPLSEAGADFTLGSFALLYAYRYFGATPATIMPGDFTEAVFDLVPRKVSCEPGEAPEIISVLRAFWAFAAREFGASNAQACLAVIGEGAEEKLRRALADPSKWGMAKSFVTAGLREGYDMGSPESAAAFTDRFNTALSTTALRNLRPSGGAFESLAAPVPQPQTPDRKQDEARRKKRKLQKASRRRNR